MESLVYAQGHGGLGDAIICNGLIRVLARRYTYVFVPCKVHNYPSVSAMWSDLDNVKVLKVEGDKEASDLARWFGDHALRLGLHSGQPLEQSWDAMMYRQAGVKFSDRWDEFRLPPMMFQLSWPVHQAFLHDDPERGFVIDRSRLTKNVMNVPKMKHIFEVLPWLQTAPEIHVIDSCFLCLADSVPTKAKRLVLHAYATAKAKPAGPPVLKKNWEIFH